MLLARLLRFPGFAYRVSLHGAAFAACFAAGATISLTQGALDAFLGVLRALGATIDRDMLAPHRQREFLDPVYLSKSRKRYTFIDEKETLAASRFPVAPKDLIAKAKEMVDFMFGCEKPEILSEDFQFIFPVVGPLSKADFTKAFSEFKTEEAFPDAHANYYNFSVDPMEPNRVWMFARPVSVHSGTLNFAGRLIGPTGKTVVSPPQVLSFSFDEAGKCYKMTGGYCVDRVAGNTGGLGGLFGVLYAIGKGLPLPEAQPWKPSPQWEGFKRFPQIEAEYKRLAA